MRLPASPTLLLSLILLSLLHLSTAAKSTATSFCKCICFNNSTIIALSPPTSTSSAKHLLSIRSPIAGAAEDDAEKGESPKRPHHKLTCADCTRAFCLDYNLPICKDARDEDVFTTCFQRDSLKDETVVVIFIFATAGLLAWALVKPWVDRLRLRNERANFAPLMGSQGGPDPSHGGSGRSGNVTGNGNRQEVNRGPGGNGRGTSNRRGGMNPGILGADEHAVDIGSGSASRDAR